MHLCSTKWNRWKKKKPSFSHTQALCSLHIAPNTHWQPTPKRLLFWKKVTFESLLFLSLDTKTSNITSCLMPSFLASASWAGHMFLWSFRALLVWLSTVTFFGAFRSSCDCWSVQDATRGSATLPSPQDVVLLLSWTQGKSTRNRQAYSTTLLLPAGRAGSACCYPPLLHPTIFWWRRGASITWLLPFGPCFTHASPASEPPLVRLYSQMNSVWVIQSSKPFSPFKQLAPSFLIPPRTTTSILWQQAFIRL